MRGSESSVCHTGFSRNRTRALEDAADCDAGSNFRGDLKTRRFCMPSAGTDAERHMQSQPAWTAALLFGLGTLGACGSGGNGANAGSDGDSGGPGSATGGTSAGGNPALGGTGGLPTTSSGGVPGGGGSATGNQCGDEPELPRGGEAFDCGPLGHTFENAGPPSNRVNYVILGDGYTAETIETAFLEHVENMLHHEQAGQYSAIGEPYGRYRKFVNVCGLKIPSNDGCIDNQDIGRSCDTPFDGRCNPPCGSGGTRLGTVNATKVNDALQEHLPENIDADWRAVTLNGDTDGWWNSGGPIMVWNGNFGNRLNAASVALHEGGHTFHRLADEYGGSGSNCAQEYNEINSTADPNAAKWEHWLEYDDARTDARPRPGNQSGSPYGTRVQEAWPGSRYCDSGQFRPSEHSEMNLLPRPFNMPSVEKIILDIYAIVDPIDSHTDNSSPLEAPSVLQVRVIDPEVISVDWSVDGEPVEGASGECFAVPTLAPGMHTVTARAHDDTPWVRRNREELEQTVSWEIVIP